MTTIGAFYVAMGDAARYEARLSIETLLKQHPDWCVKIVSDQPFAGFDCTPAFDIDRGGRRAKVRMFDYIPATWDYAVYLDADTRVRGPLTAGIDVLSDGWEMALAFSKHQNESVMHHVSETERETTCNEIGYTPLQMQAGVIFARRCDPVRTFYRTWEIEWQRWEDQDQAAFLRALHRIPLKVWTLGRAWNGGAVIEHLFGRVRGNALPVGARARALNHQ